MLHFKEFQKEHRGVSMAAMRKKLYGALAMLLVASTLMVTSTYAWFVLSTAPEVSNIKTQVGANGALELALLNTESWENLALLDMGDIDESATESLGSANLTWGNLVNLGDRSYGLSQIILQPSRLNIAKNGTNENGDQYKVQSTMLKTPVYGEDGRVQGLDSTSAVAYICSGGKFATEGYGVRAIGTCADLSAFQLGMNTAKTLLSDNMSKAKTAASKALSDNGAALANLVVAHSLDNKENGFTASDVAAIKALATGMQSALGYLDAALRQVFAGYAATEAAGISPDNYDAAVEAINSTATPLSSLMTTYPGIADMVPLMETYIQTLTADQTKVTNAVAACDSAGDSCTWAQISAIVNPLVDTDKMTLGGQPIEVVQEKVMPGGELNYGEALSLVTGGVNIGVPSGSGLLSDIADYAGNYASKVKLENFSAGGFDLGSMEVVLSTVTNQNPVYLNGCSTAMRNATVATATGSAVMTDFYGYALDLAFRTNAADSQLLLQTEPENRVYEGDTQNESLQGGGSYMSFLTGTGISANKMVRLMSGIRVVMMDDEQNVLAIATLDCTLGKNLYASLEETPAEEPTEEPTEEPAEEPTEEPTEEPAEEPADETGKLSADLDLEGMSYYLNASKGGVQQSDLISAEEYEALPDESAVMYDRDTGELKAKLYLHEFEMTESLEHTAEEIEANGDKFYTGGITIGDKIEDGAITKLVQDKAKRITAVVYIDGGVVTNAMVAANAQYSMTGTLNLQFSSDAILMPAQNSALQTGRAEYSPVAVAGEDYVFNGTIYTVNEGYAICKKSTDHYDVYYYNVNESAEESKETYVKLTEENCSTALTVKPVTPAEELNEFTQVAAAGQEYSFGGFTCIVNEGYAICKKSGESDDLYYHNVAVSAEETDANHVKLTPENFSTALTVKPNS